jgi:CBS domain-containing protein
MPVPIMHLVRDRPAPLTIVPDATLRDALLLMMEHDFTQLPVAVDNRPAEGGPSFVTTGSIARALLVFGGSLDTLRVRDALTPARTLAVDEDLFSRMDDLLESYAALLLTADGTIAGIVTSYDTTQYFRQRAEDMLLVEDVETTLKDHIRSAYGGDESDPLGPLQNAIDGLGGPMDSVKDACRKSFRKFCAQHSLTVEDTDLAEVVDGPFTRAKKPRTFDDLTLSDYISLARRPEAWAVLGPTLGVPEDAFRRMMEGLRETRNKLMHFRPDIGPLDRQRLRFCAGWFKTHQPLQPAGDVSEPHPVAPTPAEDTPDSVPYAQDEAATGPTAGIRTAVESKYAPLAEHLRGLPRAHDREALTFSQIQEIIGDHLPASAWEHRSWWANNAAADSHAVQWLNAGWRVASINMSLQRVIFTRARDIEQAYIRFFGEVQARLRAVPGFPLHPASPIGQNWLPLVVYVGSGRSLVLSFARGNRLRLECYIDTGDAVENNRIFEKLARERVAMEAAVGAPLEWERLEGKRACRVATYVSGTITDSEWLPRLIDWAVEHAPRFNLAVLQADLGS